MSQASRTTVRQPGDLVVEVVVNSFTCRPSTKYHQHKEARFCFCVDGFKFLIGSVTSSVLRPSRNYNNNYGSLRFQSYNELPSWLEVIARKSLSSANLVNCILALDVLRCRYYIESVLLTLLCDCSWWLINEAGKPTGELQAKSISTVHYGLIGKTSFTSFVIDLIETKHQNSSPQSLNSSRAVNIK